MPLASLPLLALLSGAAHAEPHGLVVRLEMPGEPVPTSAFVVLTPTGGEATKVEVKDNGTPPDVSAGDGVYAGAVWLEGDQFQVSVELDGKTIPGGPASWNPEDAARDLAVGLKGGSVSIEAGVSGGGVGSEPSPGGSGGPATPGDGGAPGGTPPAGAPGGTPSAPGTPPNGTPSAPGTPAGAVPGAVASQSGEGSLYIAFGLGVLVLVGVAWMWLRNRPAEGGAERPAGLALVPEPGLLGPGSPSLSDGLQLWIVGEADRDALLKPLVATLARHHRVLVAAPAAVNVPGVYGGPVYRSTNIRPSHVGDAAEALQREGGGVATLLFGTQGDASSIKDYADLLPTGVGAVCVVTADPGVPALARVTARRDGPVWVVQTPERAIRLVETLAGLVEEPAR